LGIKHMHDRRILHRDLKSENVFLTRNGVIKIGDFGVAKCLEYTLQKAVSYIGTPYYLSPEIVLGLDYSFASDIWSLGVILYELCCLNLPFEGRNIGELNQNIIRGAYKAIPTCYSSDLACLVKNLLSVKEEKRFRVHDILNLPFIHKRILEFLSEMEYNDEFSHTVLHNYNPVTAGLIDGRFSISSSAGESNNANDEEIVEKELSNFNKTMKSVGPKCDEEKKEYENVHKILSELSDVHKQYANVKSEEIDLISLKLKDMEINICNDNPVKTEDVKKDIESLIGKDMFEKVFKILEYNVPNDTIIFENSKISKILKEQLKTDEKTLTTILGLVPDIFSILIQDRIRVEASKNSNK